jgi:hypothetical protein
VTFRPSLSVGWRYSDNVTYLATEEDGSFSDTRTQFGLNLPVQRQTERSSTGFAYNTWVNRFQEFSELDNLDHNLVLRHQRDASERLNFSLRANYTRTQDQARLDVREDEDDPDAFLAPRAQRESYGAGFDIEQRVSRRWTWRGSALGSRWEYGRIPDYDPSDPASLADRSSYGAGVGFRHERSPSSTIGVNYNYRFYELDSSIDERVHAIDVSWRRELGRRSNVAVAVGAAHRSRDSSSEDLGVPEDSTQLVGTFTARREFDKVALSVGLLHVPSSGGGLPGTATNSMLNVALFGQNMKRWSWRTGVRYARRKSTSSQFATRQTGSAGASVERYFLEVAGVRLSGRFVRQFETEADDREAEFYEVGLYTVWYPLGRTRLGGR